MAGEAMTKIRIMAAPGEDDPDLPSEVPDRNFSKSVLEVCNSIHDLIGDEWDEPPMLAVLYESQRVRGPHVDVLALEMDVVEVFPHAVLRAKKAWHPIVTLADACRSQDVVAPSTLVGVVMVVESWGVFAAPVELTEVERAAENRNLDKHPLRVEMRQVMVVDRDGVRYMSGHRRDTGERLHLVGTGRKDLLGRRTGPLGDVSNSLKYFLEVLQGLDPPPWNVWRHLPANEYRDGRP